jgi:hypothetical protein
MPRGRGKVEESGEDDPVGGFAVLYRLLGSSAGLAAMSGGASKATRAVESGAAAGHHAAAVCRPEGPAMLATSLTRLRHLARRFLATARTRATRWTRPTPLAVAAGAAADATRGRSALLIENALLRHQLAVLSRSVTRPRLTAADRGLLVLLASRLRAWAGALVIVRPETVLRWHRAGFRLFWRGNRDLDQPPNRRWQPRRSP